MADMSNWAYRKKLTIDNNKIDTALTNYPVQVLLNASNFDFTKAKADGADIRFADMSNNLLKHEKVEYTSIGKFNVQIPEVSSTTDTDFYMYYGNANAHNTSIEAWQDQTGKALTYNGNVKLDWDSGVGRRVAKFDGDGDYFTVPDSSDLQLGTTYTIEFWVNLSAKNSVGNDILMKGYYLSGVNGGFVIRNITSSRNGLEFWGSTSNTSTTVLFQNLGQLPTAQWSNVTITSTGTNTYIFLNGVLVQSTSTVFNISGAGHPLIISGNTANCSINGSMRGLRITKGRARYTSNFTPPTSFEIDGTDVVFCTNFDTIYDENFVMVQHMGGSLVDASGNGNNGTAAGTSIVNTVYGKGRVFTTNDYVNIPDSNSLDLTNEITLMAFGYYTNTDNKTFIEKSADNTNYQLQVGAGTAGVMEFRTVHGAGAKSAVSYADGAYRVYCGRNLNASQALFVNGVSVATAVQGNPTANTSPLRIGARSAAVGFTGLLNNVMISNIARSDAWIKADDYTLRQLNLYTTGAEQDLRVNPPVSLSPSATNIRHDVNNTFSFYYESVIGVGLSSYEIDYRAVGAPTWISSGVVTSNAPSGTIIQYVINANSFQKDVSYEWRARITNTLSVTSEYATSTFGTYISPSATGATPSFATLNAYANQTLTWAYSDPLSSAQTKYEVKYTNVSTGISTTTGEITSNAVTHTLVAKTLAYASDPLYTWEVRVWNTDGDVSNWSSPLQFTYFQPYEPTGTFTTAEIENEGRVWVPATIQFTSDVPTGTSITLEARSTLDGVTYTDWTSINNGSNWTIKHSKIQLRFTLNSHSGGLITPKITSYTVMYPDQYEETGSWTSKEIDISGLYGAVLTPTVVDSPNSGSIIYETRYRKSLDDNWSAWSTTEIVGNLMQIRATLTQPTERHLTPTIDSVSLLHVPEKKQGVWISNSIDVSQAKDISNSKAVMDALYHGGQVVLYSRSKATIDGSWSDWYLALEDGTLVHPANMYIQLLVSIVGEAEVRELTLSLDGDAALEVLKTGMTPGATYNFTILDDLAILVNGNDQPLKWDSVTPPEPINLDPPILSMVLTHHNRAWGVDSEMPSRLRYSNILDPTKWDAYDFIDFNPDDGDRITTIVRYGQNLVISKQRAMALLTGNRSSNYNVSWLDAESGATGANAVCVADKYLVYVAQDGIRFTDLAQSVVATERLNPSWEKINKRRLNQAALVYWKNRLFAALPSEGSLHNDTVWVYDFLRNSWSIIDGWEVSTWQKFNQYGEDILLAGSSITGQLYHVDITSYDDTLPVEFEWRSKDFNFKTPEKYKLFRNVFLDIEGVAETTTLYVDLIVDGEVRGTYNTIIPEGAGVKHTRRILPPIYGAVLGSTFGLRVRGRCGIQSITIQYAIRGNIPGGEL